jgi:hypothetical protein
MTTTHRIPPHGTSTTEQKAREAANGCHLIKHYDGHVSSVWRYRSPAEAEQAVKDELEWMAHYRAGYEVKGLTPPARPWTFEVV